MILAVDFDDVLCDSRNVKPGYRMGLPVPGAVDAMQRLRDDGHELIVHTVRAVADVKHVADWLRFFAMPFDDVTGIKPNATWFIDDRALHFDNWPDTLAALA